MCLPCSQKDFCMGGIVIIVPIAVEAQYALAAQIDLAASAEFGYSAVSS